jgi:hypothetical protein
MLLKLELTNLRSLCTLFERNVSRIGCKDGENNLSGLTLLNWDFRYSFLFFRTLTEPSPYGLCGQIFVHCPSQFDPEMELIRDAAYGRDPPGMPNNVAPQGNPFVQTIFVVINLCLFSLHWCFSEGSWVAMELRSSLLKMVRCLSVGSGKLLLALASESFKVPSPTREICHFRHCCWRISISLPNHQVLMILSLRIALSLALNTQGGFLQYLL